MTFACPCACLCAWKFNIVLMEMQMQMQRLGSQPIFWNVNVKSKHLHLVSWKPSLCHSLRATLRYTQTSCVNTALQWSRCYIFGSLLVTVVVVLAVVRAQWQCSFPMNLLGSQRYSFLLENNWKIFRKDVALIKTSSWKSQNSNYFILSMWRVPNIPVVFHIIQ